jgi:3',5'-cyclic AMP phosphodiesterase CpdA
MTGGIAFSTGVDRLRRRATRPTRATLSILAFAALSCTSLGASASPPVVLFAIGDTGDCDTRGTARVAAAARKQPDAANAVLVELGDLAYPVATRERLARCHETFWSGFGRRLAVPGNHDWRDLRAAGFFDLYPDPVPRKVALGGPWHVILLDSNLDKAASDAQLKWLDDALSTSQGECLIAAWHHPRWSSGKHGDNAAMQPFWGRMQGKVTFTLHGHDHHFEAVPALDGNGKPTANGVASFIVGNGGASLYRRGKQQRPSRPLFDEWGFLRIELNGQEYRWQQIDTDGKVTDSDQGSCHMTAGSPL